jgi:galactose mutarotase-like enzyme
MPALELSPRPRWLALAAQPREIWFSSIWTSMEIWTDQPGIQFYSGNFLNGVAGKKGAVYQKHGAFCLESQLWPDAINKQDNGAWPSVILQPGNSYRHTMEHRFLFDGGA